MDNLPEDGWRLLAEERMFCDGCGEPMSADGAFVCGERLLCSSCQFWYAEEEDGNGNGE